MYGLSTVGTRSSSVANPNESESSVRRRQWGRSELRPNQVGQLHSAPTQQTCRTAPHPAPYIPTMLSSGRQELSLIRSRTGLTVSQAQEAVRSILNCCPYALLKRYFGKMKLWVRRCRDNAFRLRRLLVIRREALKVLVCRCFARWLQWCVLANKQREWIKIGQESLLLLASRCFRKWFRFTRWHRRIETSVLPALRSLRGTACRQLMRRSLHTWWCVTSRNARLWELRQAADVAMVRWCMHRWMRRRFATDQLHYTGKLQRRNLKTMARMRFMAWMTFSVRRGLCRWLEQRHLRKTAQRYLHRWVRRGLQLVSLSRVSVSASVRRAHTAFQIWLRWIRRRIRALVLEQRHLVVLLQRYFIFWRLSIDEKRFEATLAYASRGSQRSLSAPAKATTQIFSGSLPKRSSSAVHNNDHAL